MNDSMSEGQSLRLIEWLKANGHTDTEIVTCIEYINGKH